jgi:NADH:ubiquinone oxidoreductase subunit F (NADH-binding)
VLDGAVLAADAVGAAEIVLYVGGEHERAAAALRAALAERRHEIHRKVRIVAAPETYVAGEATAAVHYVNAGVALPVTTPPRVSERGVDGRPTLVQNVESLAYAALVARYGSGWYREAGRGPTRGTALVTVTGPGVEAGVRELELGTTVRELAANAGVDVRDVDAVLLGGYFGTWGRADEVLDLPLEPEAMKAAGLTFGCGLVGFLPGDRCGLAATARIAGFLANESAGQCGPCVHGLRAIADALARVAACEPRADDVANLERWIPMVARRGACHHPDGAVQLVASALDAFAGDLAHHLRLARCAIPGGPRRGA